MQEVEAMEFLNEVVSDDDEEERPLAERGEEVTLEAASGAAQTFYVLGLEMDEVMDYLGRMPDAMVEVLTEAEDPDEAQQEAAERGMMQDVDGSTVRAFRDLCKDGLEHPELTSMNIEMIVEEFDFQVLFPIGSKVLELSFEDTGEVTDFHGLD